MPAVLDPNFGLNHSWSYEEDNWHTGMDLNLRKIGALLFVSVKNQTTTAQPGSPAAGDRYLIPASGATWGSANQIAVYANGSWLYYTPQRGWLVYDESRDIHLKYTGTAWTALDFVEIPISTIGAPTASATLFRMVTAVPFLLPASLAGSVARLGTAGTGASTVFSLRKNGSEFGTVTFASGSTTGTFTAASATSFASGDILTCVAPGSIATSLSDLMITLKSV